MKSLKDINYDEYNDPQDELDLYEYNKKLNNLNKIDLDKSAHDILLALKNNITGTNLLENSSKKVNVLLAEQDLSFLEYVNDVLVNELYPANINRYVFPVEKEDGSITYEDCKAKLDDSISYIKVLDEEYLYLNTCINVMRKNHGSFDKYVDLFSKGFISGLYQVVYELLEYADKNYAYEKLFNFIDLSDNLLRYSIEELECLKAYAKAKIDLLELHISLGMNEDNYSKYLDAQDTIVTAYYDKLNEDRSTNRSRNKKQKVG